MSVDVGIINYNGGEELTACVRSLVTQRVPVRVLVLDNASKDDSIPTLKNSGLPCQVIQSNENLGYAGACNKLLENMDSDIQVLCNMDLEFDPAWAENLQACFNRHPEAGSVASLVMEKSGVVNAVGVLLGPDLFAKNEASGMGYFRSGCSREGSFWLLWRCHEFPQGSCRGRGNNGRKLLLVLRRNGVVFPP